MMIVVPLPASRRRSSPSGSAAAAEWVVIKAQLSLVGGNAPPKAIDYALSDQIENLDDLIGHDAKAAEAFFGKTYVTGGMKTLLRQGLQRLRAPRARQPCASSPSLQRACLF